mgnify:CR=1 FL=1
MKLIRPALPTYSKNGIQKSMAWFECPLCRKLVKRQSNLGREQITCGCGVMPKPVPKTVIIPCLKCGKLFPSKDKKRNRFCAKCNRDNDKERSKSYKHGKTDGKLHRKKGN